MRSIIECLPGVEADECCPRCGTRMYPILCGVCERAKAYYCVDPFCDNIPAGECECPRCNVCGADADEHADGSLCYGKRAVV